MLATITPINWDKSLSDNCASGEVLTASSGLQRFELSTLELGQAEVTRKLWEMMA
jgi:hypothetical protein